eukprot:15468641-Alexandrium_andersonii.AAC.1
MSCPRSLRAQRALRLGAPCAATCAARGASRTFTLRKCGPCRKVVRAALNTLTCTLQCVQHKVATRTRPNRAPT